MTALYIILGIILFIVIAFSLRVSVIVEMTDKNKIIVKYLFFKFTVLDSSKPKTEKPKKEKTKKDKKPEQEEVPTEEATPQAKEKGNGFLKQLYTDHGYDGIVKMLVGVKNSLSSFFGKLYKTITINELYLTMHITGKDAANTAIQYGKISSWLFPLLGKLASTCKMKKYDVDISPDFLGVKNEADLYLRVSLVPIRVTNALVVLAVQLLFKVILKVLFANNKSKKSVNIKNEEATVTEEASSQSNQL